MAEKKYHRLCADNSSPVVAVSTSGVCGGEPCLPNSRIPVAVLYHQLFLGWSIERVCDSYPHVRPEAIKNACVWMMSHPEHWIKWKKENA